MHIDINCNNENMLFLAFLAIKVSLFWLIISANKASINKPFVDLKP